MKNTPVDNFYVEKYFFLIINRFRVIPKNLRRINVSYKLLQFNDIQSMCDDLSVSLQFYCLTY